MVLNDLFYQTLHEKKMPGAYISRISQEQFDAFDKDPVMYALTKLSADSSFLPQNPGVSEKKNFFRTYKPDVFLLTPRVKNPNAERYLKSLLSEDFNRKKIGEYILWQRISGL